MKAIQRTALLVTVALIVLGSSSIFQSRADTVTPTVTIHAKRYEFSPSEITLKQGKKVELVFISSDVPHGISLADLGISLDFSKTHPTRVTITPAKSGIFEGECSRYCGSGHNRMKLTVHVTP
jgi:cytochrome c oxidase subunit 2